MNTGRRGHAELPRGGSVSNYCTYFVRLGLIYQMRIERSQDRFSRTTLQSSPLRFASPCRALGCVRYRHTRFGEEWAEGVAKRRWISKWWSSFDAWWSKSNVEKNGTGSTRGQNELLDAYPNRITFMVLHADHEPE